MINATHSIIIFDMIFFPNLFFLPGPSKFATFQFEGHHDSDCSHFLVEKKNVILFILFLFASKVLWFYCLFW